MHTNHSVECIPSPTPHLSPNQRIRKWKVNILVLVSYESGENWARYDQSTFLIFSWPWPWPLTWSLPNSNWFVLGWWQIIPENFMQFGPVVFETFVTLTLTFDLSEDRKLRSEHFGIGFIWIRRELSLLWQIYFFVLFVTLTLTFDLSENRELKSEPLGIGFIWIRRKPSVLWPKYIFDLFATFAYQGIGNWKLNILAFVSYESDENWGCYDQNMFLTFLWHWPWPLTYQKIEHWKANILVLVSYESDENWACYNQNNFFTFSWPWP